eukprot:2824977-Pleurochrysis_carterae.AAC.1
MDSKCDQHMFNGMRWFPFGVTPKPNVVVKTAEKGVPPIVPRCKGNAIVFAAGGAIIEFTNALLVSDLDVNLASVEQAMVQNKVEVRLATIWTCSSTRLVSPSPLTRAMDYTCGHSTWLSSSTSAMSTMASPLMSSRAARLLED